jgi:hypothetical protein
MRSILVVAIALSAATVACSSSTSVGSVDGGPQSDGGCGAMPPLHCVTPCGGGATSPTCVNGSWECPILAGSCVALDAAVSDASSGGDAGFACDGLTCNAAAQYCDIRGGGVALPDAGSNFSVNCLPLPVMPCEGGTGCACIPNTCGCTETNGAITNECLYP